jgi:pyruvate dehydrogenase E2 component (dihydrolipoamide acetyltransferase)
MATPVIMPRQGQSVESCIFSEWYVKTGEEVKKGDLLFAYETDKAAFEAEAPEDGILLAVFAEPGDAVDVLQNIGVIGKTGENIETFRPGTEGAGTGLERSGIETESSGINAEQATDPASMGVASGVGSGSIVSGDSGLAASLDKTSASGSATSTGMGPGFTEDSNLTQSTGNGEIRISPRARKTAGNHHINYTGITGSGPEGRIIEKDILNKLKEIPKSTPLARSISYEDHIDLPQSGSGTGGKVVAEDVKHSRQSPVTGGFEDIKISNIRRIIAENMHASLQNTAQLTLHTSADARKIKSLRKAFKKEAEEGKKPNITINDLVCYAAVKTLGQHPDVNAHFLGDSIRHFRDVHMGFAVDTKRGLMVPTLKNASHLKLEGFAIQMKELATQAQSGKIDPELLTGATFTITNLGAFGIEMFTPVLNPPQVAILGLNTITMHPSPLEDGSFGFIPKIGLSLTFDHRAIDGAPAAAFLRDVKLEIENFENI